VRGQRGGGNLPKKKKSLGKKGKKSLPSTKWMVVIDVKMKKRNKKRKGIATNEGKHSCILQLGTIKRGGRL